jgi:hypothetical protein
VACQKAIDLAQNRLRDAMSHSRVTHMEVRCIRILGMVVGDDSHEGMIVAMESVRKIYFPVAGFEDVVVCLTILG